MKKISLIVCLLTCSVFVFGQIDVKNNEKWVLYESPKDEFSVEVPQKFEESFEILKDLDENEIYTSAKYFIKSNSIYFYVFSEILEKRANIRGLPIKELRSFIKENSADSQPKVIGKFKGEQFSFKDTENYFHRIIIIKTEKRNYIFHAFSGFEKSKDLERFIDSIKFREIAESKPPIRPLKPKISPIADSSGEEASKRGSGAGSGQSEDGAKSSNSGNETVQVPGSSTQNQTSPLRILTKPRPPYTDLARIYGIQGSILLRVTFLADGNIGSISTVNSLPFGLTNNAIKATRQIKFEPMMKNGVALIVTKTLQYTFTLY